MNQIKFEADPDWEKRFNEYLRSNRRALDSLQSLTSHGIPQDWLVDILHDYTDPTLRRRKQLEQQKTALTSLKEVDRVLKVVAKAEVLVDTFGGDPRIPLWAKDQHLGRSHALSTHLRSYLADLGKMRQELAKLASDKGEGVGEEMLVGMVEAVREVTGEPCWGSLAYLLEGSYFAHGLTRLTIDRDLIRKRYKRFTKNFPRIAASWLQNWGAWFGLKPEAKARSSGEHSPMDNLIRRFARNADNPLPTKIRYQKVHPSMKR
jgi:hypothetical protein